MMQMVSTIGGRFRFVRRMLARFVLVALLAGCAGARVTGVVTAPTAAPQPMAIAVTVDTSPAIDADEAATAQHVAQQLQGQIVQRLSKAGIAVIPAVPGTAVLHVSVMEADSGNKLARIVVGFGAGKATLQARADFEPAGPTPVAAFDTASDSGHRPGLILPGGVAFATRDLVHLAIGGGIIGVTNLGDGMDRPVKGTASAIVTQLRKYYAAAGWRWPAGVRA